MPYMHKAHKATMLSTHTPVGHHPETDEPFMIANIERYTGVSILGNPGLGKSALLQNLIHHDIRNGYSVIVIDPHGDLVTRCLAQLPDPMLYKVYLLNMEDEAYPFGLNIFVSLMIKNGIALSQLTDKVAHIFETVWPDSLNQIYLPRYLRAATMILFANPGATLVDMPRLLLDDSYRRQMLKNVTDPSVRLFWEAYDQLSPAERRQQTMPLVARLEGLFMGRSLVRNIVGQQETTINFREAIEKGYIIFVNLPLNTLGQDARLIGTLLIAQIQAAIFSFGDMPEEHRPGVSLYVDEAQNFATPDFAKMISESRKFCARVVLANQYRNQLPKYLRDTISIAGTKICFGLNHEDASEMSHYYLTGEMDVKREDIETKPVEYLLRYGSDSEEVQAFIDWYLRPLQGQKRGGRVEIAAPGLRTDHFWYHLLSVPAPTDKITVGDPTPYLDHLLYQAMRTGQEELPIPSDVVLGFSNCGRGFYSAFRQTFNKGKLLSHSIEFPAYLVVPTAEGGTRWTRPPENDKEQMLHFIYRLRQTMTYLAGNPIGKKTTLTAPDVATMLTRLPKRWAYVRSGDEVGTIITDDTAPLVSIAEQQRRLVLIRDQTRAKYCRPLEPPNVDTLPPDEPPLSRWEEV